MSIQEKLENLRRLKAEREQLANQINIMKQAAAPVHLQNPTNKNTRINSWDRHQLSMAADSRRVADWVQQDFEEFNREEIEKKLRTTRARVLISGIMEEADQAYHSRVSQLGVDDLESLNEAESFIAAQQNQNNGRKRIILNEAAFDPDTRSQSSRAASILNDDEKREIISEFIDSAYDKIIKIIKVYIIRAMYFEYGIPNHTSIGEIKDRLLGHMHFPREKWRRLPLKSRIEYLNISPNTQTVELVSAWVMRVKRGHIYVTHNTAGVGRGIKLKWRRLNHHFPIFHKISNDDINIECGFNQHSQTESNMESDLDDLSSIQSEPLGADEEYTSNDEYESD